jgi:hypothetical protein
VYSAQEALMRKYFGFSPPSVIDAERNMSLVMVSSNWVFNYPIPLMPSVVTAHSFHVKTKNDPLPKVSSKHTVSFLHSAFAWVCLTIM